MEKKSWLERPVHPAFPSITNEIFLFGLLLVLAAISRFYDLGARVMSHDESLHTYFSWLLYRGQGYQHTPMMHGPLQFHLLALSYFLFGVSDFTARIPAAIFNIATIWMIWYWRRYLGKTGALLAGVMMLISPYLLFYGRYVRNEAYSAFAGMLMVYAILRYLEEGKKQHLYLLTAALVINFTSKETAFIYAAQALLFLGILLLVRRTREKWEDTASLTGFVATSVIGGILALAGIILHVQEKAASLSAGAWSASGGTPFDEAAPASASFSPAALFGLAALAFLAAGYFFIKGATWQKIREERSFDLILLMMTLILPQLAPLLLKILGWSIPTSIETVSALSQKDILQVGLILAVLFAISIAVGLWWNFEVWWKAALGFHVVFLLLYTTFFTNSGGFVTGLLGSLGYWLEQQGVQRGSQPWYYYILIQIPVYEFLPALGSLLALYLGFRQRKNTPPAESSDAAESDVPGARDSSLVFPMLLWWSVSSVIAYSYAGERMPWLTYHITLPMILLSAWGFHQLFQRMDWEGIRHARPAWTILLMGLFLLSGIRAALALAGPTPPFRGDTLDALQSTGDFLLPALFFLGSAGALWYFFLPRWKLRDFLDSFVLLFFALLAVLTARAAYRAAYINYDDATEYLVYAHASRGVKDVMEEVEEISRRINGDLGAPIAYDASAPDTGVSWPFVWYLRNYTNLRSFDQPTRALRESVAIIVDQKNFDKIEPAIGNGYYRVDYIRMWWPNQDYFNLAPKRDAHVVFDEAYPCKGVLSIFKLFPSRDFSRVCNALSNPEIRAGIFDIWFDRDYTRYAQATGNETMTLSTWEPSDKMRLYIRKDVVAQIWKYGAPPENGVSQQEEDPYAKGTISLSAVFAIGQSGEAPGAFSAPRGIAFAPDGTFYVADSRNNRVEHFAADGTFLHAWGTYANAETGDAPIGTFYEPWGIAVAPDGSVYVTDTWNHRVEKFSADGKALTMWGHFGQAETPDAFWGPRGIVVDSEGRVYVADTGNKRIVIFDSEGQYLSQFGSAGILPGQFDEPVGLALDSDGVLYVADTWNQRVQVFSSFDEGLYPLRQWDIAGWYGESLDNKPFLAVDAEKHVYVTDPEGFRVLEFSADGTFLHTWGTYGDGMEGFGLASGIAVDAEGNIWVTDAGNDRVMKFPPPADDE
jgi:predicted membrane-bound mannosyltransferase/DNA-binding beta-propeller fold protein YncE